LLLSLFVGLSRAQDCAVDCGFFGTCIRGECYYPDPNPIGFPFEGDGANGTNITDGGMAPMAE
jgi:hypothetical protein